METKTDQVRRLVSEGEYKQALQICKDWYYDDPRHRDVLRLGYACHMYPEFYKQIGYNPMCKFAEAVSLLKLLYSPR